MKNSHEKLFVATLLGVSVVFSIGRINAQSLDGSAPAAIYLSGEEIESLLEERASSSASAGGWSVSIAP